MSKDELAKKIYEKIATIPAHGGGVIELCPTTLRDKLSRDLLKLISETAADVALQVAP